VVCFDLSGRIAAIERLDQLLEKEEPCWLCRRAGFSKIRDLESDLELPACLLGKVFVRAIRMRNHGGAVEA